MIEKFIQKNDVVYEVRKDRKTDSIFKRNTAQFFYKLMRFMKVNLVYNHADYRLCSRRVLDNLEKYEEVNLFLRGIIPEIGFKSDIVYYNRLERKAGESKYPLKKMITLAWNGITSFSNYPLKLVTIISFCIFFGCILMTIYALISWFLHNTVPGWLSIVLPM
jgi:polyisoprenyl-phosphate glycosyltransferase